MKFLNNQWWVLFSSPISRFVIGERLISLAEYGETQSSNRTGAGVCRRRDGRTSFRRTTITRTQGLFEPTVGTGMGKGARPKAYLRSTSLSNRRTNTDGGFLWQSYQERRRTGT